MSSITLDSIPESLKAYKSITPFIARSVELESINPVISYYCRIYVLEYILTNKLHTTSKEAESFTVSLLDNTESIKSNKEDESLYKVLNDKNLSVSVILSFSYKLFNSCLQELDKYKGTDKFQLIQKFKATINFLSLLTIFSSNENADIDFSKLTGGKANDAKHFNDSVKEKIKVLKYHLSKLIKDEVPIKGDEEELEDELKKLEKIDKGNDVEASDIRAISDNEDEEEVSSHANESENVLSKDLTTDNGLELPSTPGAIEKENETVGEVKLPGVPHFLPEDDKDDVRLPGAPQFLPDDDLSHINKSSSIHVFTPEPPKVNAKPEIPKSKPKPKPKAEHHDHITKESINSIISITDSITKIQKHARFAISALNYEDLETAEKELLEGLRLLKTIKDKDQHD